MDYLRGEQHNPAAFEEQLRRCLQEWYAQPESLPMPGMQGPLANGGWLPLPNDDWINFELYDNLSPGGHAYARPLLPDESGPDTTQALFYVYDAPEGNLRALGSTFMTNSHGARGKARLNTNIGHWEIVSIQQQAQWIMVGCSGCSGTPSIAAGATFTGTGLIVMDRGQDPSNPSSPNTGSLAGIQNYSASIKAAGGAVSGGIVCLWNEYTETYDVVDGPC